MSCGYLDLVQPGEWGLRQIFAVEKNKIKIFIRVFTDMTYFLLQLKNIGSLQEKLAFNIGPWFSWVQDGGFGRRLHVRGYLRTKSRFRNLITRKWQKTDSQSADHWYEEGPKFFMTYHAAVWPKIKLIGVIKTLHLPLFSDLRIVYLSVIFCN